MKFRVLTKVSVLYNCFKKNYIAVFAHCQTVFKIGIAKGLPL